MLDKIKDEAITAVTELCETAKLKSGDIMIVGCSTSEVIGEKIGTHSAADVGKVLFEAITSVLSPKGIYLAAQCCEHTNRSLIIERECLVKHNLEQVNLIPQPHAGGAFGVAAYNGFSDPVATDYIQADAGIDIGGTLIGMHLKRVAVPVRLSIKQIGQAPIICARTRLRFVGGERAVYDHSLM